MSTRNVQLKLQCCYDIKCQPVLAKGFGKPYSYMDKRNISYLVLFVTSVISNSHPMSIPHTKLMIENPQSLFAGNPNSAFKIQHFLKVVVR